MATGMLLYGVIYSSVITFVLSAKYLDNFDEEPISSYGQLLKI